MFYLPQMYPTWYVPAFVLIYTAYFLGWMP